MNMRSLLCFLATLLGCLVIGFASWLETNNYFYASSLSVSQHFSFFKVSLAGKDNVASVVTFGLWRYCISNSIVSSCSPAQMDFDIDAFAAISNIKQLDRSNKDLELPLLAPVSYVRLILLLTTSLLAVASLGITTVLVPETFIRTLQRRILFWLTSLLCFLCAVLISITFGFTYHTYITSIREACSTVDSEYICSSYTPSTEFILLAISLGIFVISAMFSIVCSVGELASISQQSHTTSSYSVYADDDDSPDETPSLHDEKRDMSDNTSSQPQRASLRPPPPSLSTNQQKIRNRSSHTIVPNRSLIRAQPLVEVGLDETDGVAPCLDPSPSRQYPTVNTSTLPACIIPDNNEAELRPPTLPFASRANNQSKNRPSSYGSNNTFGAVDGNSSNPSSPVTDDGLSLISDIDYHQRTHSGSSISNHQPNGNVFYAASAGIPSHHTLGGSFQLNSLRKKSSSHRYTSSEEEDAEIRADKQQFGTTSSSCSSSSLRSSLHLSSSNCTDTLPEQQLDDTLFQRIDDYLLVAQKKNNDQI